MTTETVPTASDTPRPAARRLDWNRAALLLARGDNVEAVAEALDCTPQRILRNLRRSRKFRFRIEAAHARQKLAAQLRFALLGGEAVSRLQAAETLEPRMLQWLGDRSGVAVPADGEARLAERLKLVARGATSRRPIWADMPERTIGPEELDIFLKKSRDYADFQQMLTDKWVEEDRRREKLRESKENEF